MVDSFLSDDGKEILSPCEILRYLLDNQSPVMDKAMLEKCPTLSNREWVAYVEGMQGSIVTCPGKRPSSIRLDQLDRDHIMPKARDGKSALNRDLINPFVMPSNLDR